MSYISQILPSLLDGAAVTLQVFCIVIVLSIPFGAILAFLMQIKFKPLQWLLTLYVWIMRGTPLLLQLIFFYYVLPSVGVVMDRLPAAILAFTLNYAAYFAEIFRGGILSIDKGQCEGAKVLGLSSKDTFFRIILPQTIKKVLPPVSNEIINLVKDTSLVYVVGLDELLKVGKAASNKYSSLIPLLVVGIVYLILIAVVTKILSNLEKKYSYYE